MVRGTGYSGSLVSSVRTGTRSSSYQAIRHSGALAKAVGALPAFVRIKRAGFRPSLNLLYALEGAILDCHWQEIPDARRSELIAAAETEVAKLPKGRGKVQRAGIVCDHDVGLGECHGECR